MVTPTCLLGPCQPSTSGSYATLRKRNSRISSPTRALFDDEPSTSGGGHNSDNGAAAAAAAPKRNSQFSPLLFPPPEYEPARGPVLVNTQRGVPAFRPYVEASNPCSRCRGTGKVTCGDCRGKGRLNYRDAAMLPSGAWPEWCMVCRASGRWYCER